jgi:CBS domain-containing protein
MSPERMLSSLAITNVIKVSPDTTVEEALRLLDEKQVRAVPVVDENGVFYGLFSLHEVVRCLVPSYLENQTLDFATGVSSILATRLQKIFPTRVGDHVAKIANMKMDTTTHTWEALRMLTKYGSPLPIIEEGTEIFRGLVSEHSAIEALLKMEADEAELESVDKN